MIHHTISQSFKLLATFLVLGCAGKAAAQARDEARFGEARFVDHSLLIAPEFPCTWPSYPFPRFQITHQRSIGPDSAYNIDVLLIDGNTGTQLDVPPHSVARPELKREKSGPLGLAYTDKIEPWQFGGEACVVDVRDLCDQAAAGVSPLVRPAHVERFERQHRMLRFGDVVLFRSDYSDKYYRPFPAGSRFIADVLDRKAPGYPDPDPDCMELRRAEARHDLDRGGNEPRRVAGNRRVLLHARPEARGRAVWRVPGVLDRRRPTCAAPD